MRYEVDDLDSFDDCNERASDNANDPTRRLRKQAESSQTPTLANGARFQESTKKRNKIQFDDSVLDGTCREDLSSSKPSNLNDRANTSEYYSHAGGPQ